MKKSRVIFVAGAVVLFAIGYAVGAYYGMTKAEQDAAMTAEESMTAEEPMEQ